MPETRAKNYIQNNSQPYNKNKRTTQRNINEQSANSSSESKEQTLLETTPTNNKKIKITTENMETSSPKTINKVIENIILSTDNTNQTPPKHIDESTTKTLDMEID